MTDPAAPTPGERRLAHPPSDRYRTAEEAAGAPPTPPRPVSKARGLAYGVIAAVVGALLIVVVGGVLTLTGGLLVSAVLIGLGTGWGLRVGAGGTYSAGRRAAIAIALALASVVGGQIGLWSYAASEGGVLALVPYLGEVFGPLVPIQLIIAPVVAWLAAR